jgi:hypothetical protein
MKYNVKTVVFKAGDQQINGTAVSRSKHGKGAKIWSADS